MQYNGKILDHLGLVAGMIDELGIVDSIDNAIEQDREKRHVSIGECVKAMIINGLGFTGKPLYLTPDFYKPLPLNILIKEGITPEHLNDNTLGRAMDILYKKDVSTLFSLISTKAFHALNLKPEYGHLDSTSMSVYGKDYTPRRDDNDDEDSKIAIEITHGFSKDHRPDLLQCMLEMIVDNRAGIPMAMKPLSGNSSDKTSFVTNIETHIDSLLNTTEHKIVVDSALYSKSNLHSDAFKNLIWVTRVPESIKEAKEAIASCTPQVMRVMQSDDKNQQSTSSSSFLNDDTTKPYAYRTHTSEYGGIKQQWIIVYSKEARERSVHTLKKQFNKLNQKEMQLIQKFEKEEFACESDMNKALHTIQKKLKNIEIIETETVKKGRYSKAGRPSKQSKKEYDYYVYSSSFILASSLQGFYDNLHQKSHFILATNDLTLEPKDIFYNYKNQHIVERGFRFLKGKEFLSDAIFIKSPERIEALLFIMTLSLMVYAALEYRIREKLSKTNSTIPDQKGKPTSTPTARWVFHCFIGIQMLIINDTQHLMMNLSDTHRLIISLLGQRYLDIYLIGDGV